MPCWLHTTGEKRKKKLELLEQLLLSQQLVPASETTQPSGFIEQGKNSDDHVEAESFPILQSPPAHTPKPVGWLSTEECQVATSLIAGENSYAGNSDLEGRLLEEPSLTNDVQAASSHFDLDGNFVRDVWNELSTDPLDACYGSFGNADAGRKDGSGEELLPVSDHLEFFDILGETPDASFALGFQVDSSTQSSATMLQGTVPLDTPLLHPSFQQDRDTHIQRPCKELVPAPVFNISAHYARLRGDQQAQLLRRIPERASRYAGMTMSRVDSLERKFIRDDGILPQTGDTTASQIESYGTSFSKDTDFASFERWLDRILPTKLPDLHVNNFSIKQANFFAAIYANARALGFEFEECLNDEDSVSPLSVPGISADDPTQLEEASKRFSSIAKDLRPVAAQITKIHHPYLVRSTSPCLFGSQSCSSRYLFIQQCNSKFRTSRHSMKQGAVSNCENNTLTPGA